MLKHRKGFLKTKRDFLGSLWSLCQCIEARQVQLNVFVKHSSLHMQPICKSSKANNKIPGSYIHHFNLKTIKRVTQEKQMLSVSSCHPQTLSQQYQRRCNLQTTFVEEMGASTQYRNNIEDCSIIFYHFDKSSKNLKAQSNLEQQKLL